MIETAEIVGVTKETAAEIAAEIAAETATTTETVIGGETTEIEETATETTDEMTAIVTIGKMTEGSRHRTMHYSPCWPTREAALGVTIETDVTATMTAIMTAGTAMASLGSLNGRSRP